MGTKKTFSIRLDDETRTRLEAIAEKENRKLNNLIQNIIDQYLAGLFEYAIVSKSVEQKVETVEDDVFKKPNMDDIEGLE